MHSISSVGGRHAAAISPVEMSYLTSGPNTLCLYLIIHFAFRHIYYISGVDYVKWAEHQRNWKLQHNHPRKHNQLNKRRRKKFERVVMIIIELMRASGHAFMLSRRKGMAANWNIPKNYIEFSALINSQIIQISYFSARTIFVFSQISKFGFYFYVLSVPVGLPCMCGCGLGLCSPRHHQTSWM